MFKPKFLAVVLAALTSTTASAATLGTYTVNANDNGGFGELQSGRSAFVLGTSLVAGQTVVIDVTGQIFLGGAYVDPNGRDADPAFDNVSDWEYTPLEEAGVDAGTIDPDSPILPNLGALIGAFLPTSTVESVGFTSFDEDWGGGIAASDLFFIGESLTFTAAYDGYLLFGINEGYVSNNSGAFTVTVSDVAVPLPASLALLPVGLGGLVLLRQRKRV